MHCILWQFGVLKRAGKRLIIKQEAIKWHNKQLILLCQKHFLCSLYICFNLDCKNSMTHGQKIFIASDKIYTILSKSHRETLIHHKSCKILRKMIEDPERERQKWEDNGTGKGIINYIQWGHNDWMTVIKYATHALVMIVIDKWW